ncbi:MAG: carbohydrate kinase family protein [Candidatus Kuenenbacteria bacterium]
MPKKNIVVSGSICYDKIMDFPGSFSDHIMPDKIHSLSVSFVVDKMKVNFGGTAGNIAHNLKLLGESPIIFSQAGKDFSNYKKWLKKNKISDKEIKIIRSKDTTSANIITDKKDNQITALHLETMGVPCGITESLVKKYLPVFLAIIAPGNTQDMIDAAIVYKKLNIPYIADPGQQIPALTARELLFLIGGAKVLMCNDYELALITKALKHLNTEALKHIRELVDILVVTYGAKGSVIYNRNKVIKIKAYKPRKIVDPTGAGDGYRAGFIKGLVSGWDLKKCGDLASKVAKYPVEHYGTQEHTFNFKV